MTVSNGSAYSIQVDGHAYVVEYHPGHYSINRDEPNDEDEVYIIEKDGIVISDCELPDEEYEAVLKAAGDKYADEQAACDNAMAESIMADDILAESFSADNWR